MLGEFCGGDVGNHHRRIEHVVQFCESTLDLRFYCSDQHPIRVEEISHCAALTQELWVRCNMHIAATDDLTQP